MKSLQEIINQPPLFIEDWEGCSSIEVARDFKDESILNLHILFACYVYEQYNGDALVLFEKDGKLYEVNGSHCSCYGLEDQWVPEEVPLESLEYRYRTGSGYSFQTWRKTLRNFLGIAEKENT